MTKHNLTKQQPFNRLPLIAQRLHTTCKRFKIQNGNQAITKITKTTPRTFTAFCSFRTAEDFARVDAKLGISVNRCQCRLTGLAIVDED